MKNPHRRADYDQIASSYDRRYDRNDYAGVESALRGFTGSAPGLRILEVGCGTGHWLDVLQGAGNQLLGLDYSAGMLARAQSRLPEVALVRGTAELLPLADKSFDRVFCINALHHFRNKPAFLAEVWHVLRPGGMFLSVGLDPHRGLDQWHVYDYFPQSLMIDRQRYPSAAVLRGWMTATGFKDCRTREVEHWTIRLPAHEIITQGRLEKAATSQLSVLTDEEYQQGIQRIRDDMERAEGAGQTLPLTMDLRLYGTSGSV